MAYTLNSINFTVYGISPGQISGSNVAVEGNFNLPARIGKTFHEWGDEDGLQAYTDATEIFFGGRDINFEGTLIGTNPTVFTNLKSFTDAIDAVTGVRVFSTPYGDHNVLVKSVIPKHHYRGTKISVVFREPVVDISGGSLPGSTANDWQIDGIPFTSFGLYPSLKKGMTELPEQKVMKFTKYGTEGFQPTKRKFKTLTIQGFLIGSNLVDFQNKIKALYLKFSATGERQVKLNNELYVTCFADTGFEVSGLYYSNQMVAKFKIDLRVTAFSLTSF